MPQLKDVNYFLNIIKLIEDNKSIAITHHRKIQRLMLVKRNMKEANCWDTFLERKRDTVQYSLINKLKIDTIDDELFDCVYGIKNKFINLDKSCGNIKKDRWLEEIFSFMVKENLWDRFIRTRHEYFRWFQGVIKKQGGGDGSVIENEMKLRNLNLLSNREYDEYDEENDLNNENIYKNDNYDVIYDENGGIDTVNNDEPSKDLNDGFMDDGSNSIKKYDIQSMVDHFRTTSITRYNSQIPSSNNKKKLIKPKTKEHFKTHVSGGRRYIEILSDYRIVSEIGNRLTLEFK